MKVETPKAEFDAVTLAYRFTFSSPNGQTILNDLMKFCCFRKDADTPIDEGKRRVFLHILNRSNLTDEQLYRLHAGRNIGELT